MKRYIKSHGYLSYNVNPRGTVTGDCQTRAIAMALNLSWDEVRRTLRKRGKDWFNNYWNVAKALTDDFACKKIDVDFTQHSDKKDYLTVADFCDNQGKQGTYLIICDSTCKRTHGDHLVCTINGTIYDTWNSAYCKVIEVYQPTGNFRAEGIEVTTDLPKRMHKLSAEYQQYFLNYLKSIDFVTKLKEAIPDFSTKSFYTYKIYRVEVDYDSVHSFNFVVAVNSFIADYKVNYVWDKIKTFNITFNETDTYESALADMPTRVTSLVDNWINGIVAQIRDRYTIKGEGKLKDTPKAKNLVEIYSELKPDLKENIVRMTNFCGYPSAIVETGEYTSPYFRNTNSYYNNHILVISKTNSRLKHCLDVCSHYSNEFWQDEDTPKINVLPYGFVMRLGRNDQEYSDDKSDFKEFMTSYEDYLYDQKTDNPHDLDWYYRAWEIPKILK